MVESMKNKIITYILILIFLFSFVNLFITVKGDNEGIEHQYAPIFYFEKDETCYPVNISYHIDNSYLYKIGKEDSIDPNPTVNNIHYHRLEDY